MSDKADRPNEDIFERVIRAGRRTYFFDVRETKAGDYYLTITESKKFTNEDGSYFYRKHKIYLYKEDFEEFQGALNEATNFIIGEKGEEVISERHQSDYDPKSDNEEHTEKIKQSAEKYTDVKFEDI